MERDVQVPGSLTGGCRPPPAAAAQGHVEGHGPRHLHRRRLPRRGHVCKEDLCMLLIFDDCLFK